MPLPPVGARMLAKNLKTPRGIRLPASSLTTIASMLAPTMFFCGGRSKDPASSVQPHSWNVREDRMVQLCSIEQAVDEVLARLPAHIHMGLPLGLGKPNNFANALYQRI